MKQFFKRLPWYVLGIAVGAIVEILDGIVAMFMLCGKALRLIAVWTFTSKQSKSNVNQEFIEGLSITNSMANENYKAIIDWLYPID